MPAESLPTSNFYPALPCLDNMLISFISSSSHYAQTRTEDVEDWRRLWHMELLVHGRCNSGTAGFLQPRQPTVQGHVHHQVRGLCVDCAAVPGR